MSSAWSLQLDEFGRSVDYSLDSGKEQRAAARQKRREKAKQLRAQQKVTFEVCFLVLVA